MDENDIHKIYEDLIQSFQNLIEEARHLGGFLFGRQTVGDMTSDDVIALWKKDESGTS